MTCGPLYAGYVEDHLDPYSASFTPFRCTMVASLPPLPVIRVESIEPWATCPEGWHRLLVTDAGAR